MGFIVFLLLIAFVVLFVKHLNLSVKKDKAELELLLLKTEYGKLAAVARTMDIQLGALHERNRQLVLNSNSGPTFNDKLVKDLIALCHPDKHGGSVRATRVTQELLKVRGK
jgi:hypothetical protein